jgi:hypothetical protein
LFSFDNKEGIFDAVKRSYRFCLMTLAGTNRPFMSPAEFMFYANRVEQIADTSLRFSLTTDDIALLNPNTKTCPVFRNRRDASLVMAIYRRVPVLIREESPEWNTWEVGFLRMLDMANDSSLFRTADQLEAEGLCRNGNRFSDKDMQFLPLYEAKMVGAFNHRSTTYDLDRVRDAKNIEQLDPTWSPQPRYWVSESDVAKQLPSFWGSKWLFGWQDVTDVNTMARTVNFSIVPKVGVGHTFPLFMAQATSNMVAGLSAMFSSFALDYVARQKIGGVHLTYQYLKQFPILTPRVFSQSCPWSDGASGEAARESLCEWLLPRVLELTYTAWDLEPFARDCGYGGPPFRWDDERRFWLRAELDAAFFHLYLRADAAGDWIPARRADGCPHDESPADLERLKASFPRPRDAVSYIMDTFPIVRRKDEEKHNGDYRTKRVILEIYDAMQSALRTGHPYQTRLAPPPADPRVAPPPKPQP